MDDWIQLTEEDIERAQRVKRSESAARAGSGEPVESGEATNSTEPADATASADAVQPDVVMITSDDLPAREEESATAEQVTGEPVVITMDDLQPAAPQPVATADVARLEEFMFRLVNEARREHLPGWVGTATLTWNARLAQIARQHSTDMLRRQYVAHVTPEGVTAAMRLRRNGIGYVACGENIGIVYGEAAHTAEAVRDIHEAFMAQPRSLTNHRGNLLNPIWTHCGIGIAYNPDGALVATQCFISAPASRLRGK
ncbi:MAG: CAP domain-containing protein [Candidatus Promineifilaceae bacterium]|nr:CAP domain-containing protein [Candidatus Promineifilaceae bacterium]